MPPTQRIFSLPGTFWGKALHSPYPHARILRIDTQKASRLAGVHAVITGADVTGAVYGQAIRDIPAPAHEVVRFVGERVCRGRGS
jgi:CO/xanthine dehydrogenase Mo-binding subunit